MIGSSRQSRTIIIFRLSEAHGETLQQKIGKKIRVMADFNGGQVKPVIFKWQDRNYKIKSVSMAYQERDGSSINYYFSVETDTGGVFKLRYNNQKFLWWLEESWQE